MTYLALLPPVIAFLLLAAHFFRADNPIALIASLVMIGLVFVRRPWSARAIQVALLLGALEWLRSTVSLVLARHEAGAPFLRLAIILGAVTLLTALSALVFQARRIRAHFGFAS